MFHRVIFIISSGFYALALTIPYLAWLVIPSLLMWGISYGAFLRQGSAGGWVACWYAGVMVIHFSWLYRLLSTHFVRGVTALLLTIIVVVLAALILTMVTCVVGLLGRLIDRMPLTVWALTSQLSAWFIFERWGLWWVLPGTGCLYPYASPWTVLSSYRWFLQVIGLVGSMLGYYQKPVYSDQMVDIVWLKPGYQQSWAVRLDPSARDAALLEQKLYQQLLLLKHDKPVLCVGSESFMSSSPASLKRIQAVSRYVGSSVHCLVGCADELGLQGHTVAWFHNGVIKAEVGKRSFVPGIEVIPCGGVFRHWFVEHFFATHRPYQVGRAAEVAVFEITPTLAIRPFICAEFFITDRFTHEALVHRNPYELWAVFLNESWFTPSFVRLMDNYLHFKAALYHQKILVIGHLKSLSITPFSGTV